MVLYILPKSGKRMVNKRLRLQWLLFVHCYGPTSCHAWWTAVNVGGGVGCCSNDLRGRLVTLWDGELVWSWTVLLCFTVGLSTVLKFIFLQIRLAVCSRRPRSDHNYAQGGHQITTVARCHISSFSILCRVLVRLLYQHGGIQIVKVSIRLIYCSHYYLIHVVMEHRNPCTTVTNYRLLTSGGP